MEQIKEAFSKVKQDIDLLKKEVSDLNKELIETRESLIEICAVLRELSRRVEEDKKENKQNKENENKAEKHKELDESERVREIAKVILSELNISKEKKDFSAQNKEITTEKVNFPTDPGNNSPQNHLKNQNKNISIGNEGVPTDRQTNQQTNQQTDKSSYNLNISSQQDSVKLSENSINNAAKILDSLDNLKKEIRLKFKRLTDQEFFVFSTIYQLSEEFGYTDYKNLSEKLNLTESSIRDYIGRLIKKGIPLDKTKINNKTIHISISPNLKKVASLPTILQLRAI